MESYRSKGGRGLGFILLMTIFYNILILIVLKFTNSYVVASLLKIILVSCNIYQIYYMLFCSSLKCTIDEDNLGIYAIGSFKKVILPLNKVEGYTSFHFIINLRYFFSRILKFFSLWKSFR